jgi:hypothetical protein
VVVLRVQQDEGPVREPLAQVVGGADAGDAGADDEDVDMAGVVHAVAVEPRHGPWCSRRHPTYLPLHAE